MSALDSRNFGIYDTIADALQPSFIDEEVMEQSNSKTTIPSYQFGIYSSVAELIELLDRPKVKKTIPSSSHKSHSSMNMMNEFFI